MWSTRMDNALDQWLWPIFSQMKVLSQTLLLLAHFHCKPTQSARILARCGYWTLIFRCAQQGSNAVSIVWSNSTGLAPGNFGSFPTNSPCFLVKKMTPWHHYSSYACNSCNKPKVHQQSPTSDRSRSFINCMVHSHCVSNGTDTITSDFADVQARCKLMSQHCAMARVTESQLMPSKRSPWHRPNLHRAKLCSHWDPITPEAEWNLRLLPCMVRSQVCIKILQVTHASRFQDLPIEPMIPQPLRCGQRHRPWLHPLQRGAGGDGAGAGTATKHQLQQMQGHLP